MKYILLAASFAWITHAEAHDQWANGQPIPPWIKSTCCGPADAHHLSPTQVHIVGDHYEIDGVEMHVPLGKALPTQDGDYWIFYACNSPNCNVYCFFAPMVF